MTAAIDLFPSDLCGLYKTRADSMNGISSVRLTCVIDHLSSHQLYETKRRKKTRELPGEIREIAGKLKKILKIRFLVLGTAVMSHFYGYGPFLSHFWSVCGSLLKITARK